MKHAPRARAARPRARPTSVPFSISRVHAGAYRSTNNHAPACTPWAGHTKGNGPFGAKHWGSLPTP
eukprot:3780353-Prymnesium_polylepis.1